MKINWKALLISIAISLGIGILAGLLTGNSRELYTALIKPPLSPPGWVFPVVWTILYLLMGISAYLIYESGAPGKDAALGIYGLQLVLNFAWSILFFQLEWYLAAFLLLVVLWFAILAMIKNFYKINPLAGWLQVPYLLWVTFAGYLNLAVFLLNR